ncbi:hypothetical protein [Neomegalonema perideroedes]|uniref:hypothetical protein n=1 Tax=Neomegalonema perideroedes TaxID=217219 RepID=UPI000360BF31|nr:hypothetical protein [Neomegalonema perideroedes]
MKTGAPLPISAPRSGGIHRRRALALLAAPALLAGCQTKILPPSPYAEVNFLPGVLNLRLTGVQLVTAPTVASAAEDFPVRVADFVRLWSERRLRTIGGGASGRLVIDEARGASQETPPGPLGPGERFEAVLQARLAIDENGAERGFAGARVTAEGHSDGPLTPAERTNLQNRVAAQLAERFDLAMSDAIRTRLGSYLA